VDKQPIDFNDADAVNQAIKHFCDEHAFSDLEHSLDISPKGYAYSLTGSKYNVDSGIIGEDALIGSIGIHNHPVGYGELMDDSFSRHDLLFANKYKQGKQYLVSGRRRNAFEFTQFYTDNEIYSAWENAYYMMLEKSLKEENTIEWEQEEILKILGNILKGFTFYENF